MKYLVMLLASVTLSISANAWHNVDLSDEAVISDLETIQEEIDGFHHKDRAMKFAFRKLERVKKKLTKQPLGTCPQNVNDQDLATLIFRHYCRNRSQRSQGKKNLQYPKKTCNSILHP